VIRFLADEDFNNDLLRALRRRRPAVDVVRVQDVGLSGPPDPAVLAWPASALRGARGLPRSVAQPRVRLLAVEPSRDRSVPFIGP
jgi:hypothetical protein